MLVTDGNQRSTLAVVRALGRAGIPVTVGETTARSLAGSSAFCAQAVQYPCPLSQPAAFLDSLADIVRQRRPPLLLPMTDATVQIVSRGRRLLERDTRIPLPDNEAIEHAQDKRRTALTAEQFEIAVPLTFLPTHREDLEEVARSITYPAVIKPRRSRFFGPDGCVSGTVQFAHSPEDLVRQYHEIHSQVPWPLVQECISGEGRGIFLLLWEGELKAAFAHRRIREKPPWGGVSVLSESVPLDRELVEKCFAYLSFLRWQGPAMLEFKVDSAGRAYLMEINGRFWGSLQLATDAGINFPLLLYRLARGEKIAPQLSYRTGVQSRWLLGDLDHLLLRLKHRPATQAAYSTSRARACLEFFRFHGRDLHCEEFRFGDVRPFFFAVQKYVRSKASKLAASARPALAAHAVAGPR